MREVFGKSKAWEQKIKRQEEYGYSLALEGEGTPFRITQGDTKWGIQLIEAGQRGFRRGLVELAQLGEQ